MRWLYMSVCVCVWRGVEGVVLRLPSALAAQCHGAVFVPKDCIAFSGAAGISLAALVRDSLYLVWNLGWVQCHHVKDDTALMI